MRGVHGRPLSGQSRMARLGDRTWLAVSKKGNGRQQESARPHDRTRCRTSVSTLGCVQTKRSINATVQRLVCALSILVNQN